MNRFCIILSVIILAAGCNSRHGNVVLTDGSGERYVISSRDGCPEMLPGTFWSFVTDTGEILSSDYFAENGSVNILCGGDSSAVVNYTDGTYFVSLEIETAEKGLDLRLCFTDTPCDIVEVSMPASYNFQPENIEWVVFPNEIGVKLKRGFYLRQAKPKIWEDEESGSVILNETAGLECLIGPDVPVAVTPADRGKEILAPETARQWGKREYHISRASATEAEYNFIDSPNGAFFGGHKAGGGILLRFAGKLTIADAALAPKTVAETLNAFREGRVEGYNPHHLRQIAIFKIDGCPPSTGWNEIPVDRWIDDIREIFPELIVITSISEAFSLVSAGGFLALINPYGEMLPAGDTDTGRLIYGIREFLKTGGIWVETGGYPFFRLLRPSYYNSLAAHYPTAFSDIFEIASETRNTYFYGIQEEGGFVPMRFRTWADEGGGHISRTWERYIRRGESGYTPVMRLVVNCDFRETIREYSSANGFRRSLEEKMEPAKLEKWKRAPVMKMYGKNIREQAALIPKLPSPSIVHIWTYLKGGFDKLYPEHLPPHPRQGTMRDFEDMIAEAHRYGHLFMPYTNNTWWCDDPAPDILKRTGDEALLKKADGTANKEVYGTNYGWSISPWHPEVIKSNNRITDEFIALGCDIFFQDQVGAREWISRDFNPSSPSVDAYQQGIINLSADVAAKIPVSTEHGYDQLLNIQSEFCGLTWMSVPFAKTPWWLAFWLRSYSDMFDPLCYEIYPLAQYVADGKALFTHHLGGPLVENSETLAWTLVLGYQIIINMTAGESLTAEKWDWVNFLAELQNKFGPYYMGRAMLGFEYLAGSGNDCVIRSLFENYEVVANLTADEYIYKDVAIASKGFYAESAEWIAGLSNNETGYFIEHKSNE